MEESRAHYCLSLLSPSLKHTHTSPYLVGVQVSAAPLKEPQASLSGKLTTAGKSDTQEHKNTGAHSHISKHTNWQYYPHSYTIPTHNYIQSHSRTNTPTPETSWEVYWWLCVTIECLWWHTHLLKHKHCHFDEQLYVFNIQAKHSLKLCFFLLWKYPLILQHTLNTPHITCTYMHVSFVTVDTQFYCSNILDGTQPNNLQDNWGQSWKYFPLLYSVRWSTEILSSAKYQSKSVTITGMQKLNYSLNSSAAISRGL